MARHAPSRPAIRHRYPPEPRDAQDAIALHDHDRGPRHAQLLAPRFELRDEILDPLLKGGNGGRLRRLRILRQRGWGECRD
jgi:hypothetical protein